MYHAMIQYTLWYGTATMAKHCFRGAAPTGLFGKKYFPPRLPCFTAR